MALVGVMTDLGNPFEEESAYLLRLHSRDIMDKASLECLTTIKYTGEDQYRLFVRGCKPLTDAISRNKVSIFNEQPQRKKTKSQEVVTLLKSEASLYARLYVACQTRDGVNQPFPPSLSSFGQLRQGKQSDLTVCLEPLAQSTSQTRPNHDIYHGWRGTSEHHQALKWQNRQRLYFERVCALHKQGLQQACRIDIVWDQCFDNSLKANTRESRVSVPSSRIMMEHSTPVPKNWQ